MTIYRLVYEAVLLLLVVAVVFGIAATLVTAFTVVWRFVRQR